MRLEQYEVDAIKGAAVATFGSGAVVRLFGSRVNDQLRGGDIDLHIEVDDGQQDIPHAARFRWDIYERLEEQKIDLVFHVRGRPLRFIDEIAMTEGVIL